jgi:3-hydroxyisobutyrate dehydrogenase/glyoxylate/succinic semialdehyde reductase
MEVAFLGLGIMGSRMAAHLVQAGYKLTVWNRSSEKAAPLAALGATVAETAAQAVRNQDVVITMLSTPQAVEATALGADGFLAQMKPGAIWMDCSTVNPSFTRRMAKEASNAGIKLVDAPVAGSKVPAEKAQLLFLVGGAAEDVEKVKPLMDKMGRGHVHGGENGMGTSFKMIFNMLLGQSMLAFAEALVLGEGLGISREQLFDVLQGAIVVAPSATSKRAKIEADDYDAEFPLQWMQKDLELVSLSAYEKGIAIPSTNTAKAIYMLAARYGFAEKDLSAIYAFLKQEVD